MQIWPMKLIIQFFSKLIVLTVNEQKEGLLRAFPNIYTEKKLFLKVYSSLSKNKIVTHTVFGRSFYAKLVLSLI